jgi:HTH-type transcriptional regulator, cell division transcriptional repressor
MPFEGERIRRLREKKNWTQDKLAAASGISQRRISEYERDVRVPLLESIRKIATALETTEAYLLGETNDSLPPRDEERILVDTFRRGGWNALVDLLVERHGDLIFERLRQQLLERGDISPDELRTDG